MLSADTMSHSPSRLLLTMLLRGLDVPLVGGVCDDISASQLEPSRELGWVTWSH